MFKNDLKTEKHRIEIFKNPNQIDNPNPKRGALQLNIYKHERQVILSTIR